MLLWIKSDASTISTSSGSSAWSVNVSLNIFWWFDLDNKIYIRNIKTSGGNISCYEDVKLAFFESLESDLALILSDVTVHDFDVFFNFIWKKQLICFCLCWTEHNCLPEASIADQNISQGANSVLPRAIDGEMVDCSWCFVFEVLSEINHFKLGRQKVLSNAFDPTGDSCWEEKHLKILRSLFLNCLHN